MGKRQLDARKVLKRLGLRIRELRNEHGWTLEDCEEHGYPSWRHLQLVESGKQNVTVQTLVNISNLFNISIGDLFVD